MYTVSEQQLIEPGLWEQKLAQQQDPLQRLAIIDQLASHYAYTNVLRAEKLLDEQWKLLQQHEIADFTFHFYLNKVVVLNQLYNFKGAAEVVVAHLVEARDDLLATMTPGEPVAEVDTEQLWPTSRWYIVY